MSRRAICLAASALVVAASASGCSWFHRDNVRPSTSPTSSQSLTSSGNPSDSASGASRPLSDVVARSQSAGGANVQIRVAFTGVNTSAFSGLVDVRTGEGQGDFTSASGRVSQRIIKGGKTYTEAGSSWVATSQNGRGLVGGDLPSLWRTVQAGTFAPQDQNSYRGTIAVSAAFQLAGIDANTVAGLDLTNAQATLTLSYDSDGLVQRVIISALVPGASKTMTLTMDVSDVGQIVDVVAPTVSITGGPEGQ